MSRRDQIRMTGPEVHTFVSESRTCILCSTGPGGLPHPMPMWFALDEDGTVRMTTFAKSQKITNLRRDPRVSLLFEAGTRYEELRGVLFYGRAELVEKTDDVLETLMTVTLLHRPPDDVSADLMKEAMRSQATKRVAILVKPERTVSWDHRKLGGVY
ncbi:MAG: pyridoxamine 5'-phosphate oxidase family protein [Myxococcota bacterium]